MSTVSCLNDHRAAGFDPTPWSHKLKKDITCLDNWLWDKEKVKQSNVLNNTSAWIDVSLVALLRCSCIIRLKLSLSGHNKIQFILQQN